MFCCCPIRKRSGKAKKNAKKKKVQIRYKKAKKVGHKKKKVQRHRKLRRKGMVKQHRMLLRKGMARQQTVQLTEEQRRMQHLIHRRCFNIVDNSITEKIYYFSVTVCTCMVTVWSRLDGSAQ